MTQARLRCSYNLAGVLLIALGIGFLVLGCASLFKLGGLSDEQAELQTAASEAALADAAAEAVDTIRSGLAEGQDLKVVAAKATSVFIWQIATVIASGAGAILSGLLAKWLKTERSMTTAMIVGVENGEKSGVKDSIKREAVSAGVEATLHKRVKALTGS